MKLDDALAGVSHLGFDTVPIIYFAEANPRYATLAIQIFQRVANGSLTGITSVITFTEVLVQPIRRSDADLSHKYSNLLLNSANFETVAIDTAMAKRAAWLRARYNLRTPDALQLAVALESGCQAFLTNDILLKRVTELRVLVLDELSV